MFFKKDFRLINTKRAELTSTETAKIILAVIGIVLLLYLLVSLYGIFTQKTKIEQAKKNLENIIGIMEDLNENQVKDYIVESPKDWDVLLFSTGDEAPVSCRGMNCLCFCDGDNKEDCDEEGGVCKIVEKKIIFDTKEENHISLDEIPQKIFLTKINNEITISDVGE